MLDDTASRELYCDAVGRAAFIHSLHLKFMFFAALKEVSSAKRS